MEDYLQVGVITKAHGVRGEVAVFPTTDDPKRFKKLKTVLLESKKERKQVKITSVKFVKNMVILKLEGIDDRDKAETYRQAGLFVTREQAVPLGEDEWFIADMYGLAVSTDEGEALGVLDDVLQTGANDVYVVKTPDGKEILIPALKQCILDVNMEARTMTVHLLPGLREEV